MKIGFRHIRLFSIFSLISILSLTGQMAYGQQYQKYNYRTFNWGFKLGLNALSVSHYKAYMEEVELPSESYQNKSGYDANLFFRINLEHFFMQPEVGLSLYNQDLSFSLPAGESGHVATGLSIKSRAAKVNVLVGYNVVKNGPFLFSVFIGPSLRYHFDTRFTTTLLDTEFRDTKPHYNTNGAAGFSINIAKVHFDVRYELSIFNTNIEFDKIADKPESFGGVSIHKNENILSFSCGMMF
jgi:hypothetical protein